MDHNYPSTWTNMRLGDMGDNIFYKGKGLAKSDFINNGAYSCIHYGELFTTYKEHIVTIHNNTNLFKNCFLSKKNDVLMPTSDVTPNGLATASCILKDGIILGGDILVIRISPNKLNGIFLAYMIKHQKEQVMKLVSGTTVYHLYGIDMAKFTFSYPNIKEQQKIATVLSDMDSFIEKTESLIQKKRHIKMATMQQLLTPTKTWEEKKFTDIFIRIPSKNHQINTQDYNIIGKYPVIDQGQELIVGFSDNEDKVFTPHNGSIIFGDHTRNIKYVDFDIVLGADGTQLLSVFKEYNTKFIYYLLKTIDIPNTGYNRHIKYLLEVKFIVPLILEEQQKIAAILSDMDREIEVWEQKVIKLKNIKKASMDILLTGKIRLV